MYMNRPVMSVCPSIHLSVFLNVYFVQLSNRYEPDSEAWLPRISGQCSFNFISKYPTNWLLVCLVSSDKQQRQVKLYVFFRD